MQVDFTPLTHPVTREDIRIYRNYVLREGLAGNRMNERVLDQESQPLYSFIILTLLGSVALLYILTAVTGGSTAAVFVVGVIVQVGLLGGIAAWKILKQGIEDRLWEHRMRLEKFAAVNGLLFIEENEVFFYPGMMAQRASYVHTRLYECIRVADSPLVEWGNYESYYEKDNSNLIRYGYIALELDRAMPHMILDSRSNNWKSFGIEESNIKSQFSRDQRIELEGDFASHFTLYAPNEYKTDAYYIFTPDFMAELVDEAGDFDVEIIDNYLFLYRTSPFSSYTPELVDKIFRIISIVGNKMSARSSRYADTRVPNASDRQVVVPAIAQEGRRLKRSTTAYTVLAVGMAVYALFILVVAGIRLVDALY